MRHRPRRFHVVMAALVLTLSWAAGPVWAEDEPALEANSEIVQPTSEAAEGATATVPLGFGGLRVVVDPQTGRIVADPPSAVGNRLNLALSQDLLRRMSTSHDDLVQQPGARGGTMVHLQGRFLSPLVAVVQPDGSVVMDHATVASEEDGHDAP